GIVFMRCHRAFCCCSSEARPARPRIELCARAEQRRATNDAAVHAVALILVITMTEGPLGAVLLRNMELLGRTSCVALPWTLPSCPGRFSGFCRLLSLTEHFRGWSHLLAQKYKHLG